MSVFQDVEIDIELAPGDQTSTPKTKELSEKDIGNQLHMLTNRHDKFLDTLREVKVCGVCQGVVGSCPWVLCPAAQCPEPLSGWPTVGTFPLTI